MIGEEGLKPSVIREINLNLTSHELIKIRVMGDDREARNALISEICDATGAQPVQTIGRILVIYRPLPPEAKQAKQVKRRPGRKAPRKTKRSFQKT